jgi:hypothetical protein
MIQGMEFDGGARNLICSFSGLVYWAVASHATPLMLVVVEKRLTISVV